MKKVGFVTIGQSPRPDMQYVWNDLKDRVEIMEIGALDNYSKKEIEEKFNSKDGKDILVTKLRDGQTVQISKNCIYDLVQQAVYILEKSGCKIIVLLCTGDFNGILTNSILIELNKLLTNFVKTISDSKKIGIVIPDMKQKEQLLKRWLDIGINPEVFASSPYGDVEQFYNVAKAIKERNLDIIIMDCMGYDENTQNIFKEITKSIVILPRKIANGYLKSII